MKLQTGYVYHYAFAMLIGVTVPPDHLVPRRGRALMFGFGILSGLIVLPLVGAGFILACAARTRRRSTTPAGRR